MKKINIIIFILTLAVIPYSKLMAQCDGNNIFNGTTNSDWNTASNWSAGCVPTSPISGHIQISAACIINSGTYTFSSGSKLEIDAGISLTNNGASFSFDGDIAGEGTFVGNLSINGGIAPGPAPAPAPPIPACVTDCHFNREVANGEGFDFGSPTAAALMNGISSGVQNTTGDGDEFNNPGAGMFGPVMGPAPGHEPPCPPLTSNITQACGSFFTDDADHIHRVVIPAGITSLTLDTCSPNTNFDTIIIAYDCSGTALQCFDPAGCGLGGGEGDTGTLAGLSAGDVIFIVIDGFQGGSNGNYELTISGS